MSAADETVMFDEIPVSTRKPGAYFEFNTKLANASLPTNLQRVLLFGQRLQSGTVEALKVVNVFNDNEAALYFGHGSIAHRMVTAAIRANEYAQITVITVDDSEAGQAAIGKVAITGPATARGALAFYVGADRIDIPIDNRMTAAQISNALALAVENRPDLPVMVSSAAGVITVIAKNKGAAGNEIKLEVRQTYASGVSATVTPMAGGLNDPDLKPAYAAVFASSHEIRVCPFSDLESMLDFRDHLEAIGNPLEQRDAIGAAGFPGTLAGATTVTAGTNCALITYAWYNKSARTSAEIAAGYATVMASEEHPARPLNNLEIAGLDITPEENWPGRKEQENALYNGVTPVIVGPGNRAQICRAISTYLVDQQGIEDTSCLDITVMRTLHYYRKACRQRVSLRFPRALLSNKTPPKIRTTLLEVAYQCEDLEILQDIDKYKARFVVQKHPQNKGMCAAAIPAPIVHGMHVFAGRIDLYV